MIRRLFSRRIQPHRFRPRYRGHCGIPSCRKCGLIYELGEHTEES